MKKFSVWVATMAITLPVMALPTVYTNEAAFLAELNNQGYLYATEDFENRATGAYGTAANFGLLNFDSSPSSAINILGAPHGFGGHNTTAGGQRFLSAEASPSFHDDMHMTAPGLGSLIAWGATFTDLDFGTINFLVDGTLLHNPAPGANANEMFVGFIGSVGDLFNTVTLSVNDNTYGIDDVHFAAAPIPEPATLSLLSLGMLGLAVRKRVRKS